MKHLGAKVVIIGHVDHVNTCLTSETVMKIKAIEPTPMGLIQIAQHFKEPISGQQQRRQRRANERKNKK